MGVEYKREQPLKNYSSEYYFTLIYFIYRNHTMYKISLSNKLRICQGYKLIYPKSTSVIEMNGKGTVTGTSYKGTEDINLTEQYTSQ